MTVARLRATVGGLAAAAAVVALSLGLGLVVVALAGFSPAATAGALWRGALSGPQSIDGTVQTAVALVLAGLAWVVAARAGRINVGLEGQMLAGGIAATLAGLSFGDLPAAVHLPLAVAAGAAGGGAWAGVAAGLWAWRGVNEIIATFVLNLIALLVVLWLVNGPIQEPTRSSSVSATVAPAASWPRVPGHPALYGDVLLAALAVAVVAAVLRWTTAGFRLRLTGASEEAARHAGVPVVRVGALALVASGSVAGLAGSSLILASPAGAMHEGFSSGLGYEGIAVALLARNSPLGCVLAALLFAALRQGGGLAQTEVGVDTSLIDVTLGLVIIAVAAGRAPRLSLARG